MTSSGGMLAYKMEVTKKGNNNYPACWSIRDLGVILPEYKPNRKRIYEVVHPSQRRSDRLTLGLNLMNFHW